MKSVAVLSWKLSTDSFDKKVVRFWIIEKDMLIDQQVFMVLMIIFT